MRLAWRNPAPREHSAGGTGEASMKGGAQPITAPKLKYTVAAKARISMTQSIVATRRRKGLPAVFPSMLNKPEMRHRVRSQVRQ